MTTLRSAVKAKCIDCIYDPKAGGTWIAQTTACAATNCPLHPVRPVHRDSEEGLERRAAWRATHPRSKPPVPPTRYHPTGYPPEAPQNPKGAI